MIRSATLQDADQIREIYNYYIFNTTVSFEKTPVSLEEMTKRMSAILPLYPWLVYVGEREILGYAYATKWKPRYSYRQSVESTIYLREGCSGKGIGTALYSALIDQLIKMNIHTIIGGIALPNRASIKLHEKLGFEKVAQFREVGYKFDQWIDVGYWQRIID